MVPQRPEFSISEVYLKKTERIDAFLIVIVFTLMMYSIPECMIRKCIKKQGIFTLNQVRKPTQRSSLKWIFTMFARVTIVSADINDTKYWQLSHINESIEMIVGILGTDCQKYFV